MKRSLLLLAILPLLIASRASNGTYSLPAGNPVTTGTAITSSWANATLTDIGTTLTDSLSRTGKGSMSVSLKLIDGALSAPGLNFASEPATGLRRAGSTDFRLVVGGSDVVKIVSSGALDRNNIIPLTIDSGGDLEFGDQGNSTYIYKPGDMRLIFTSDAGDTLALGPGSIDVNNRRITSCGQPGDPNDVVTKIYADNYKYLSAAYVGSNAHIYSQTGSVALTDPNHVSTGDFRFAYSGVTGTPIVLATPATSGCFASASQYDSSHFDVHTAIPAGVYDCNFSVMVVKK